MQASRLPTSDLRAGEDGQDSSMPPGQLAEQKVVLARFKQFAAELREGPLRDDILSQPDEVSSEEYLANCRVWLRLARLRR